MNKKFTKITVLGLLFIFAISPHHTTYGSDIFTKFNLYNLSEKFLIQKGDDEGEDTDSVEETTQEPIDFGEGYSNDVGCLISNLR